MVRLARKEYEEAIAVLERAIKMAPDEGTKAYLKNELDFFKMEQEMAEDE